MCAQKLDTEVRREQIIQAVLGLVATQGLKNLTIAGVARRVGLVPSAVYRHFKSKDALLEAVLDYLQDGLLGNIAAVRAETMDPCDRLYRLLMRHVSLIRENAAVPRIVFSEDVYGGHAERKQRVHSIMRAYLSEVADIVREGQARGQVSQDLDPDTVAVMFLGLIQPAAILWHVSDGGFDVTKHAERSWSVFRASIETR